MIFPWKKICISIILMILVCGIFFYIYHYFYGESISPLSCTTPIASFEYRGEIMSISSGGIARTEKKYPGCDSGDSFLWKCDSSGLEVQIWSSCNIGASTLYGGEDIENLSPTTKRSIIGDYYTWGSDTPYVLSGIHEAPGFMDSLSLKWQDFWDTKPAQKNNWTLSSQGPCRSGYHIPTREEWTALIGYPHSDISLPEHLGLPGAGILSTGGILSNIGEGYYWSSSEALEVRDPFDFSDREAPGVDTRIAYSTQFALARSDFSTRTRSSQDSRFSIRCMRDPGDK